MRSKSDKIVPLCTEMYIDIDRDEEILTKDLHLYP